MLEIIFGLTLSASSSTNSPDRTESPDTASSSTSSLCTHPEIRLGVLNTITPEELSKLVAREEAKKKELAFRKVVASSEQ
ncbi:MAG: hypothetical protein H6850_03350 [Alphaproteobacteria bacterium]|nr:MAG: hypothetical protein H6850_03350 [Alphaproteobacteria bacterium]